MIDTHNTGDSKFAFFLFFFGGIFARLIEMHFFETILLALLCGFTGTFAKHAGSYAWNLISSRLKQKKSIEKKEPNSPQ